MLGLIILNSNGIRTQVTMRLLATGLRRSSVTLDGILDIVQANNRKNKRMQDLMTANADDKPREAMTRCKGDVQADAKLVLQEEGYDLLGSVYVQIPIIVLLTFTNTLSSATSQTTAPP